MLVIRCYNNDLYYKFDKIKCCLAMHISETFSSAKFLQILDKTHVSSIYHFQFENLLIQMGVGSLHYRRSIKNSTIYLMSKNFLIYLRWTTVDTRHPIIWNLMIQLEIQAWFQKKKLKFCLMRIVGDTKKCIQLVSSCELFLWVDRIHKL